MGLDDSDAIDRLPMIGWFIVVWWELVASIIFDMLHFESLQNVKYKRIDTIVKLYI